MKLVKVSDEEAKALDPRQRIEVGTTEPEVEGQEKYIGRFECMWCGQAFRAILDTDNDTCFHFVCPNCGRHTRCD